MRFQLRNSSVKIKLSFCGGFYGYIKIMYEWVSLFYKVVAYAIYIPKLYNYDRTKFYIYLIFLDEPDVAQKKSEVQLYLLKRLRYYYIICNWEAPIYLLPIMKDSDARKILCKLLFETSQSSFKILRPMGSRCVC